MRDKCIGGNVYSTRQPAQSTNSHVLRFLRHCVICRVAFEDLTYRAISTLVDLPRRGALNSHKSIFAGTPSFPNRARREFVNPRTGQEVLPSTRALRPCCSLLLFTDEFFS